MATVKKRLDVLLVERGLAESRQRAQAVIMSGQVYVDGRKTDKAGVQLEEQVPIEVRGQTLAYVSRGGLKLEKALKAFSGLDLSGVMAIVCSKMARPRSMRWTWGMGSWRGASGRTPGWCAWSAPMCAI